MRIILKNLLCLLLILLWTERIFADYTLPDGLQHIETEAFAGDVSLTNVIIPSTVTSIGSRAFAETKLKTIKIPSTVSTLSDDIFENVNTPMLIATGTNAPAVQYALLNNLDFRADTVCRALIIGQTDYSGADKLYGPEKDIGKIKTLLDGYTITTRTNQTAEQILDSISSTFSEARDEDISLFYYCGHGNRSDGALVGIDLTSYVTPAELRHTFDSIPGRKIIIVDACYSGALIVRAMSNGEESLESDPSVVFIEAFSSNEKMRKQSVSSEQYFMLVSSKANEKSYEASYGGIFTDAFAKSKDMGDTNDDGVVTVQEAYLYTKETVSEVAGTGGRRQSVQVYPDNCYWFGLFR